MHAYLVHIIWQAFNQMYILYIYDLFQCRIWKDLLCIVVLLQNPINAIV